MPEKKQSKISGKPEYLEDASSDKDVIFIFKK